MSIISEEELLIRREEQFAMTTDTRVIGFDQVTPHTITEESVIFSYPPPHPPTGIIFTKLSYEAASALISMPMLTEVADTREEVEILEVEPYQLDILRRVGKGEQVPATEDTNWLISNGLLARSAGGNFTLTPISQSWM